MLRSEAGIELIIEDDVKPEKQKRKQGVSWLCIQYQLLSCPVLLRSVLAGFIHPAVGAKVFLALWLLSFNQQEVPEIKACLKYCRGVLVYAELRVCWHTWCTWGNLGSRRLWADMKSLSFLMAFPSY